MIEFEIKARVPADAVERVREALGAPERVERQVDTYFAHPVRRFAETDEALRVRVVTEGEDAAPRADVTYKGPKLEAGSKARREVKTGVADAAAMGDVLRALGFRDVATVSKTRTLHAFRDFEAAFDSVDGLDGAFIELERVVPEDAALDPVREDALAALRELGVTDTERRSYLELLLEKENP